MNPDGTISAFVNRSLLGLCLLLLLAPALAAQEKPVEPGGGATPKRAAGQNGGEKPQRPANLKPAIAPTFADVKYGQYDATLLDFWQAKSDKPTPLLINIHGGGFLAGSKSQLNAVLLDECLKSGISVASVEYRFSKVAPYPAQMMDCARAVQFLRSNAGKWNLDPKRFASTGGSAGAGISVWLAFHDDLADPKNDDPVLRESTRLTCVMVVALQSTYDPREIRKIVPGNAYDVSAIKLLHGLPPTWNWDKDTIDPSLDARLKDASPITHLTKDDVPVFVCHNQKDNVPGNIHNANFGKYLKEEMDKAGIECVAHMDSDYPGGFREQSMDMFKWMKKHFAME